MSIKNFKAKSNKSKVSSRKNKITGLIIFAVIYVIAFLIVLIPNFGKSSYTDKSVNSFVFDDYDVFSEEYEQQLNNNSKAVQQKYGVNIYISTCERYGSYYGSAAQNGDGFRLEHGFAYNDNLVIIILNCKKSSGVCYDYHFDVYTFGKSAKYISDSEIEKIIWSAAGDDILTSNNTSAKNGLIAMTQDLGKAYSGILSYRWGLIVVVTTVVGALIALAVNAGIKKSYSKKRDNESYSFSANSKLNLTVSNDVYSHKNVTYIRINTSSSGGHGGHSSGGGGGGGHRGGR